MGNEQGLHSGAFFCKILDCIVSGLLQTQMDVCHKKTNSLPGLEKVVSLLTGHPWHYIDAGHILFYLIVAILFPVKEVLN